MHAKVTNTPCTVISKMEKDKKKRIEVSAGWMSLLRYGGAAPCSFPVRISCRFAHCFDNRKELRHVENVPE